MQIIRINAGSYPPMTNADRIIRLESFRDTEGERLGGINPLESNVFMESLEDFEYVSLHYDRLTNIVANGRLHSSWIAFVNADFWKVFDFEFLYGKPFSEADCANRKKAVVITENVSRSFFSTPNGAGKKITLQREEYEVVGVVKVLSLFAAPTKLCTVWVPYVCDKFGSGYTYVVDVLTPPAVPLDESKEKLSQAVSHYFSSKNREVDFSSQKVETLSQRSMRMENLLQYGGMVALLLFLLIPALNILSFGIANTGNRAEEIAVRKTFGASRVHSFFLIIAENLALAVVGAIVGLALAFPAMNAIQSSVMQGLVGNSSLLSGIDYGVIFIGVLPAAIIFSLLSGGIPAYRIAKRPVAQVLKGGSK
ncbi:MAG: ABC transporter permease [Prevotellaceae bacterium]|nr:ABC transporter permease [Prevotellaceae bacterium]